MPSNSEEKLTSSGTEAWLREPLPGVNFLLTPAADALIQAAIDIERAAAPLTAKEVWSTPAGRRRSASTCATSRAALRWSNYSGLKTLATIQR